MKAALVSIMLDDPLTARKNVVRALQFLNVNRGNCVDDRLVVLTSRTKLQAVRFALRPLPVEVTDRNSVSTAPWCGERLYMVVNSNGTCDLSSEVPTEPLRTSPEIAPEPMISVVIPCYRQAHLVGDALMSVERQTYRAWECLVVDDGSPDDVAAAVHPFIARLGESRVRLIRKQNQGLAEARNTGIAASRGSYILPLDSDDKLREDALSTYVSELARNPESNCLYSLVQTFGAQTDILHPLPYEREKLKVENQLIYASLFPKSLWEAASGYRGIVPYGCEDYLFWLDCVDLGLSPRMINQPLFLYRKHAGTSMVDGVNANRAFVFSCAHTAAPHLYSYAELLAKHRIIASMGDEQASKVTTSVDRFPSQFAPWLWRGLWHFNHQRWTDAARDLEVAFYLSKDRDWQAGYHLLSLAVKGWCSTISAEEVLLSIARNAPDLPDLPRLRGLLRDGGGNVRQS